MSIKNKQLQCTHCGSGDHAGRNWLQRKNGNWIHECWVCQEVFETSKRLPEKAKSQLRLR